MNINRNEKLKKCLALGLAALLAGLAFGCGGQASPSSAGASAALAPPPVAAPADASLPQAASSSSSPASVPAQSWAEADGPLLLTVPAPSLAGNLIGEGDSRQVAVCLPPGYSGGTGAWPVLYFLTGYSEGYEYRAAFFYKTLEGLYAEGALDGMIVVVVNGANRFGGGWYANSPVSGNWEDFIAVDLPAFIDANFRTRAVPDGRCLAGHSMGGAGALAIAMRRPGAFGSVYAMSPAILPKGQLETFGPGFELLEMLAARYEGLPSEEAERQFMADLDGLDGPYYWPLAYAFAFGWNVDAGPPYIDLPARNAAGGFAQDDVWRRYEAGIGALEEKLAKYGGNLSQLSALAFDYGRADEFAFIPPGCEELAALLNAAGLPYTLEAYDGGHNNRVEERLRSVVLPFAARQFE